MAAGFRQQPNEYALSGAALDALHQLSTAIASDLNLARIGALAVSHARNLLPADAAHLWVWEPRSELLRCLAREEAVAPAIDEWMARPGESIVGNVFASRKPLLVDDYPSWEHAWPEVVAAGVKTALGVPLLVSDRPVGAMVVHNYTAQPFDLHQTQLLAVFGAQVGPAIEIARLYEESEQRRAEAEAINRSLAEGVAVLDQRGQLTYMNPAGEALLGWNQGELEGKNLHEVAHYQREDGSPFPPEECPIQEAIRSGGMVTDRDDAFTTKDGRIIPVEYSASPVVLHERHVGMVLAFRDITARRRNEAAIHALNAELEQRVLERTADLEISNRELESFAYSVSHDLRAPLRAIDGFSRILARGYRDAVDEQGRDYLNRISAASQRMGQLIDDLLNLSRITRTELRQGSVDMSAIVRSIADDLRAAEPQRNATFHIEDGLTVRGDARLLRAALENLVGNAWKFTSKKPETVIEFGKTQQDGRTAFFVRDNGAGFDMAYVDKLFGAFQRLHGPTEFEGTGIGLATVQRIIRRHGGEVWAEGLPEKGATFFISFREGDRKGNATS